MKSILNTKLLAGIGILSGIAIFAILFFNNNVPGSAAVANAINNTRNVVDSLDGEIENPNNPDITVEAESAVGEPEEVEGTNTPKVVEDTRVGPQRMVIDKLGINAYIQHVGLAKSGNMAVPTNYKDVGWYKLGPEPGEAGNAVIAGHLDNSLGFGGVFKNLHKLEAGDIIKVTDDSGTTHSFKVSHKKIYSYNSENTAEIFEGGSSSRLVLITCSGSWISGERSYDQRLVVFADQI